MLPAHTSFDELLNIRKAFEANTSNNGASPFIDGSSGSTLSRQSLDTTFVALVSSDADFKFMKQVPRRDVKQILVEYNRNISHGGGWYRSSYIGQSDEPSFQDAVLERKFNEMNYLAEAFAFNKVSETVESIQDPEVIQSNAALRRLTESLSRNIWYGDRSLNPLTQMGFEKTISSQGSDFVYDCRNQLPTTDVFKEYSSIIRSRYFGVANEVWMHPSTRTLFDQNYENLGKTIVYQNQSQNPGNVMLGNIVPGINDSNAKDQLLLFRDDIWMDRHSWDVPKTWNSISQSFTEGPVGELPPDTPSFTLTVNNAVAGSKFTASDVGDFIYRIAAGGTDHKSWSAATTVAPAHIATIGAAGDAVDISITPAGTGNPVSKFAIFRSVYADSTIVRYLGEVAMSAGPTTLYSDLNENIPGTTIMVMGDFNSRSNSDDTRTYILSELLAPFKTVFPYNSAGKMRMRAGMVEYYAVMQILAPEKLIVFKNCPVAR
jgi:hypothetical protein